VRVAIVACALIFAGALARFALARPAIEVRFPRQYENPRERHDLARFVHGSTVRVSSAFWALRHHPGYLLSGHATPTAVEKWVSDPRDREPWAEVELREPHDVDEVAFAFEPPAPRRVRIECFEGARRIEAVETAQARQQIRCPGARRVRATFFTQGQLVRLYRFEARGR